jgi:hypothetical protein
MRVHAKYSTGADGLPVGYPVQVVEVADDGAPLQAGFDAIYTRDDYLAYKESFRAQVDPIMSAQRDATRTAYEAALKKARVQKLLDEPGERALARAVFNHENRLRDIVRFLRATFTTTAQVTNMNTAGIPTAANSQPMTVAQFLAALEAFDSQ